MTSTEAGGMDHLRCVEQRLDRLYAELAELRRYVVVHAPAAAAQGSQPWKDLIEASREISALWTGPDAVDEIRSQREK